MDMFSEYSQLMQANEKLRSQNEYQSGIELLIEHESVFPDKKYEILFNQLINSMLDENHENALDIHERIVNDGMCTVVNWELFDPIRDNSRFKDVLEKSDKIRQSLQHNASQEVELYFPENYETHKAYPLFIALHGDTNDLEAFKVKWPAKYTTDLGYITLYIQSSQVICTNGYGWVPDFAITNSEISKAVSAVISEYLIDESNVVIGGFSGGAIAAIEVAMSNSVNVSGVIGLCPSIKPPSLTSSSLKNCKENNKKFVIFAGEKDGPDSVEMEIVGCLQSEQVLCRSHINPNIGHAYPADFKAQLSDAIDWIQSL
ncbi:hypothetical protein N473_02845 [Pseudoalteromonas luteoviolacea CPMOR-1]|uniref:Phospholipase/carboxylesterase/thioesterase domain-containing protein n=1 Tax=Pseudoalteromonas luteoviolacea CPMOR-1 TaxID=1365248 RepID=A0A161YGW4_9GAMM|nr:hypothetical protein [Pseudoalteromonas luteoviolacea]KZN59871.1 hypothetical protein N473_02845 [Pseudoalteromonas luteoviolacea CPMOR-1]